MKRISKFIFIAIFPLFLGSCVSTIDVLWYQTPYVDEPETSVILIGRYSKYNIRKVITKQNDKSTALSPRFAKTPHINVAAFKVKVGDTIEITNVNYIAPDLLDKGASNYTKNAYAGHSAKIKKPFVVKITKKGIYHLGTIYIKGKKVLISHKIPPKVLTAAKRNYQSIFNTLKPINF